MLNTNFVPSFGFYGVIKTELDFLFSAIDNVKSSIFFCSIKGNFRRRVKKFSSNTKVSLFRVLFSLGTPFSVRQQYPDSCIRGAIRERGCVFIGLKSCRCEMFGLVTSQCEMFGLVTCQCEKFAHNLHTPAVIARFTSGSASGHAETRSGRVYVRHAESPSKTHYVTCYLRLWESLENAYDAIQTPRRRSLPEIYLYTTLPGVVVWRYI